MNKKRGISLITLIITIIVIIILAGAIILSLNNTNIIGNANKAVTEQDKVSLIDTYTMIAMDKFVGNSIKNEPIENIDINELYSKIGKDLGDKFRVESNGLLEKHEDESYNIIAKFPNSISYTRNKIYSAYNNPFIPLDFEYLEGTWDTGLVIKNKNDNNEFVWIPVKNSADKTPEDKYYYYKKRNFENTGVELIKLEEDLEYPLNPIQLIADEKVELYGGFYIGRYEAATKNKRTAAGDVSQTDLIIQPLKPVYNYVTYYQARELSNGLYNNKKSYISTLTTGKQWDTACMFLGKEYSNNSVYKDGSDLGNYSGVFTDTAVNEYKVKNIYDMAGNMWEWTNEKEINQDFRIIRGGGYKASSSTRAAGSNYYFSPQYGVMDNSFRVSLYIK